jgi:hypothetical protein
MCKIKAAQSMKTYAELNLTSPEKAKKPVKYGLFRLEQIKSLFGMNHIPEAARIMYR